MRESEVESHLCDRVKQDLHGLALKFVSPGCNGVPDRILLVPMGRIWFVETKAPTKTPRKRQKYIIHIIRALGFRVLVLDTKQKVDQFIREVMNDGV